MEVIEENKLKDTVKKMDDERLISNLGHYHVLGSNSSDGYPKAVNCKQWIKALEEELLRRMKTTDRESVREMSTNTLIDELIETEHQLTSHLDITDEEKESVSRDHKMVRGEIIKRMEECCPKT